MADRWLDALALLLLFEGLTPLLMPSAWRQTLDRVLSLRDGQLRFIGLGAVAVGLALVARA